MDKIGTHDFIKFPPEYRGLDQRVWLLLGEVQARIEMLKWIPIPPDDSNSLLQLYVSKGVHSTTAIEGNSFSEEEVSKIITGEMLVPPSRDYQRQEVMNMVNAFNRLHADYIAGEWNAFDLAVLNDYHSMVLAGLKNHIEMEVKIGELRVHKVTVGRYRAAPPEDLPKHMRDYCEWLNEEEQASKGYELAAQIVKAITAHVYFAWIHPYGDGNGRMGRFIEFVILVKAGVPEIAAHLLSNFYNETRMEYYRRLQESHGEYRDGAYPPQADLSGFLRYALQGFKDQLDEQYRLISGLLQKLAWHEAIHAEFRKRFSETLSPSRQRQERLMLELIDLGVDSPLRPREIRDLSTPLYALYYGMTDRAVSRDLSQLAEMNLLAKTDGGFQPNERTVLAFLDNSDVSVK